MKLFTAVAVLVLLSSAHAGTNWALLCAGSNTWSNYRHQSDIYHAYQILKAHGFPDDNIIVMHEDDIGNNPSNPTPGVVINKPDGPNVYDSVPKDYTSTQVTADNFLKVLTGDASAGGKVINSGPDDRIFVYYSDHGASGLVAMPHGPYLYAKDLNNAIQQLISANKFKEMAIYIEACESGSMFDGILPDNQNVWALSASTPYESSYAYYFDSKYNTYLGDEFSIRWMEHSDDADFSTVTLKDQFDVVVQQVKESSPQQYGNVSMGPEVLNLYQAFQKGAPHLSQLVTPAMEGEKADSRDVDLHLIMRRILLARSAEEKVELEKQLRKELAAREEADATVTSIVSTVVSKLMGSVHSGMLEDLLNAQQPVTQHDCLKTVTEAYRTTCGFTDYSLKHVRKLSNMCEARLGEEHIVAAIQAHCA